MSTTTRSPLLFCHKCDKPFEVPPDKVRRKLCDDCYLPALRESGKRTGGLAHKATNKPA